MKWWLIAGVVALLLLRRAAAANQGRLMGVDENGVPVSL